MDYLIHQIIMIFLSTKKSINQKNSNKNIENKNI